MPIARLMTFVLGSYIPSAPAASIVLNCCALSRFISLMPRVLSIPFKDLKTRSCFSVNSGVKGV